MKSQATTVADYIAESPADRRAVLKKLRALCRAELKGTKEGIDYGMPVYKTAAGDMMAAFASQKNYIGFYGCGTLLKQNYPEAAAKLDMGKGCIRFKKPEQVDLALIQQLLREKQVAGVHSQER